MVIRISKVFVAVHGSDMDCIVFGEKEIIKRKRKKMIDKYKL